MTAPFAYDGSTEVMRALTEVTIVAGLEAFVPQLVSRAGALVSVLHTETELCAFPVRDYLVRAHWKHRCGVCVSWAQLRLSSDQVSWVFGAGWLLGDVSAEKLGWGGVSSSSGALVNGCIQRKWVLVEIPSHVSVG